jgi:hypothetical protein
MNFCDVAFVQDQPVLFKVGDGLSEAEQRNFDVVVGATFA